MDIDGKKFILFGGKGGVGKTSCAAATGIYTASQNRKTLLVSTDPAHSLSDAFEISASTALRTVKPGLDILEIDAASLLEAYKKSYGPLIKQIAEEGTFFSNEDIQQFFDLSLPGMDELMALLKVTDLLEEGKYDLIILDTAPTGHTIRLLELPQLMTSYVKVLAEMRMKHRVVVKMMVGRYVKDAADAFIDDMHKKVERVKVVLGASTTAFIPVLIPEALALAETERLYANLQKHEVPVQTFIINRVVQGDCTFCSQRAKNQDLYRKKCNTLWPGLTFIEIPLFPTEVSGGALDALAGLLFGQDVSIKDPSATKVAFPSSAALSIPISKKVVFFGGKGGVGKTTCAAAAALELAQDRRVLLLSTDPAHSLGDIFERPIGKAVSIFSKNLSVLETDAYASLASLKKQYREEIHQFFQSVLSSQGSARIDAPYDRRVMEDLFDLAPPGIDEIMALKTMMECMETDAYDLIIVDTSPTGHTIRLLEMPGLAEQWISTLLGIQEGYPLPFEIGETLQEMLRTIRKVGALLRTDAVSFILVTIAEKMAVLETEDLLQQLNTLQVFVDTVIINKVYPDSPCAFCQAKRLDQATQVKTLRSLGLKDVILPLFDTEVKGESLNTVRASLFKR